MPAVNITSFPTGKQLEISEITKIEEVNNVRIRSYPCPKVSNEGLIESWSWTQAASIAISAASAYVAYQAAKDQYDIADRYWRLARDEWDFFYDNYRPLEEQELRDIWKEGKYGAEYNSAVSGHLDPVDNIINKAESHEEALSEKYCICQDPSMARRFKIAQSTILGDMDNFARRYAENEVTMLNDRRRNRRLAAANRGRDLLSGSTAFASKANAAYSDYAQTMTSLAEGAAEYAAYLGNRRPTVYNSHRDRIDTRIVEGNITGPTYSSGNTAFMGPPREADISYNYRDVQIMDNVHMMGGLDAPGITGYSQYNNP